MRAKQAKACGTRLAARRGRFDKRVWRGIMARLTIGMSDRLVLRSELPAFVAEGYFGGVGTSQSSNGAWRNLVAHRNGVPGVVGSSPAAPTSSDRPRPQPILLPQRRACGVVGLARWSPRGCLLPLSCSRA